MTEVSVGPTPSILDSIKKVVGIEKDFKAFDQDLIMHINSVFTTLCQLGVGPATPYFIEGSGESWSDFTAGRTTYNSVRTYMYVKVRLLFDPPTTSFAISAMENQAKELEWRLSEQLDEERYNGNR